MYHVKYFKEIISFATATANPIIYLIWFYFSLSLFWNILNWNSFFPGRHIEKLNSRRFRSRLVSQPTLRFPMASSKIHRSKTHRSTSLIWLLLFRWIWEDFFYPAQGKQYIIWQWYNTELIENHSLQPVFSTANPSLPPLGISHRARADNGMPARRTPNPDPTCSKTC